MSLRNLSINFNFYCNLSLFQTDHKPCPSHLKINLIVVSVGVNTGLLSLGKLCVLTYILSNLLAVECLACNEIMNYTIRDTERSEGAAMNLRVSIYLRSLWLRFHSAVTKN